MSTKNVYEEAIADVKKLKELAEQRARDAVLAKVEPQLKKLVEQQLFDEGDEEDLDETSSIGAGAIQGSMSEPVEESDAEETQYEVAEGADAGLAELADFTRPVSDDRFVASVYRVSEDVQALLTADRKEKLTDSFCSKVEEAISKLEDMYAYLRESYVGDDKAVLEVKLEKGYGLVNAVKESTMKMRDLLNEEDLTVKINNLPDGVDPDAITIDVVQDDAVPGADASAPPAADPTAAAAPPIPTAEGDEGDEDDEVLEISEADLKAELARLRGLAEGDAAPPATKGHGAGGTLDDFGDADSEGHPGPKGTADGDLDDITEGDNIKLESARKRLARATKRLNEAKGTEREDFARAMYNSAAKAYREARGTVNESKPATKKISAPAVKNTAKSMELAEANAKVAKLTKELDEAQLLNAKLIHANKLLRIEGLTKAQQAMVIDRLDEAQSLREVRLISENIKAVLVGSKGSVNESATRRPSGSASRPSKSGATSAEPLTEGLETARWAQLAGLK